MNHVYSCQKDSPPPHLHKSLCLFTASQIDSNSSSVDGVEVEL
jgi:hypothetical protein